MAVTSLDITAFDALLKTVYDTRGIEDLVYPKNPTLAMIPKNEAFTGDAKKIPVIIGNPQGRSASFSTAQTNQTNGTYEAFLIKRVSDYQLANINNETIKASKGDEGAFMQSSTTVISQCLANLGRSLAVAMFLDGSGSIGQVEASSGTVVTLTSAEDVAHFEVGQTLVAAPTSTGAVRAGTMVITAVDRIAGTFTCSGGLVAGLSVNDYLFVQGDAQNGAGSSVRIQGFAAWLPFGASAIASNDSFWGVNRSVDRTRLGGIYYDATSEPIEEALIDLAELISREGGEPGVCVMSHKQWANLKKAVQGRGAIDLGKVKASSESGAEISFRSITVATGAGDIEVVADVNCPTGYAYMLEMDSWCLESLGKAPDLLDYMDGLKAMRNPSQDSIELRAGYYGNISCNAPGHNGVMKLPSI